jgi:hypothetical protein
LQAKKLFSDSGDISLFRSFCFRQFCAPLAGLLESTRFGRFFAKASPCGLESLDPNIVIKGGGCEVV